MKSGDFQAAKRILGLVCICALATLNPRAKAQVLSVTTYAGSGESVGSADGSPAVARFSSPRGVAVDRTRVLYVADRDNHTIRKVLDDGTTSTLAGYAGEAGAVNGTRTGARFNLPAGVAVDNNGILYVADTGNHAIRRVDTNGVVTTFAGLLGTSGTADGTGTSARFKSPEALALASNGDLLVVDSGNHTLRRITSAGIVTTLAGMAGTPGSADGSGSAARFNGPGGVALDTAGNLYVADTNNATLRKITPAGVVTTLAGLAGAHGNVNGTGSSARFDTPVGVAVNAGQIYVSDLLDSTLRLVTGNGAVSSFAGLSTYPGSQDGRGSSSRLGAPSGLAVDSTGQLFVADLANNTILSVSPQADVVTLVGLNRLGVAIDGPARTARFDRPFGLGADAAGNLYVADSNTHSVRKISTDGTVTTLAGSPLVSGNVNGTGSVARFAEPTGIAVAPSGNIYVTDRLNSAIRKITSAGVVTTLVGNSVGSADGTVGTASFRVPEAIVVDGSENLYVVDQVNRAIRYISAGGTVTTLKNGAGQTITFSTVITGATLLPNNDLLVSADGVIYRVRANENPQIYAGKVVLGASGFPIVGYQDGAGDQARFSHAVYLTSDSAGNVYAADFGNQVLRLIKPDRSVSTIAGLAGKAGLQDGTGSIARFAGPAGLALANGYVYVADSGNDVIRRGATLGEAKLINLSARAQVLGGESVLITGLVVSGGPKKILARGVGPTLGSFGVAGPLARPELTVFDASSVVTGQNSGWTPASADLLAAIQSTGAFPFSAANGFDAALVQTVASGATTVHISAKDGGTGVALAELYDADALSSVSRFSNLSARAQVGTGENVLIIGLVIGGTGQETVLVRGIGPGLRTYGVTGFLVNPLIQVVSNGVVIATNDDWNGTPALKEAFTTTGAFALEEFSRDAALVLTLNPGAYTVVLSGVGSTTGVGLMELYEMR